MKGLYKRGNVWWIRYAGPDGRMIYKSSGSLKCKEAEGLLIHRKQEVREGKTPDIINKINFAATFAELSEEYMKWCERQRSYRSKKGFIAQLMKVFGNQQLRHFNTRQIEQYQTDKLKENKPATVNRHIATLKHMFTKAAQWDMITEDVLNKIKRVRLIEENNRRLRFLAVDECKKLIDSCDHHLAPIVITALNTGMRKGEILSLKWDNIDLVHGFILLVDTKNGERREVPINDTLKYTFKEIVRRLDVPYVFHDSKTGKSYRDIKKSFSTALKKAGIRDFHFHDLRHTFASQCVMGGVDLTTVKDLLGHKSLSMTLRYAHLALEHKAKGVDILDRRLNEKSTIQKPYTSKEKGIS